MAKKRWTELFVTKNESSEEQNTSNSNNEKNTTQNNTVINTTNTSNFLQNSTTNSNSGAVDQNLINKLQSIFDSANMPGPDLHEFIVAVKKLENKSIDDKTKYEMVFDAQSSVGLTKQKLIDSGKFYIDTFNDVKSEFEKEYKTTLQNSVTSLNTQADNVIKENADLQKSIEDINKKIQENLIRMQKLRTDASVNENKLMQEKMAFEGTFSTFLSGIQKYIDGVNVHIN